LIIWLFNDPCDSIGYLTPNVQQKCGRKRYFYQLSVLAGKVSENEIGKVRKTYRNTGAFALALFQW